MFKSNSNFILKVYTDNTDFFFSGANHTYHLIKCLCVPLIIYHLHSLSTFVHMCISIEVCVCVLLCVGVFTGLFGWISTSELDHFPCFLLDQRLFSCVGKEAWSSSPSAGSLPVWLSKMPVLIHPCVSVRKRWTVHLHSSLCIHVCFILHHHLLISPLHPSSHHAAFKVIYFFIRICQQSALLWEDNWIRLFSWVHV